MEIKKLTIAEIETILYQGHPTKQFLETLEVDSRLSVGRLLKKWCTNQEKKKQEMERLMSLYESERKYYQQDLYLIAGVDEAGRGPLAGPVVASAVILPPQAIIEHINDSKKLSAKQREDLYKKIYEVAIAVAVEIVDAETIDRINIYDATRQAMYGAISQLNPLPQAILTDAMPLPELIIQVEPLVGGDGRSASIAAASIVAKVTRDRLMEQFEEEYPGYGFIKHKGYGTAEHLQALETFGPCPIHRKSFAPVSRAGGIQNGHQKHTEYGYPSSNRQQ